MKPETAIQMRQFMEGVVLRGTGRNLANLKGYTSGGKTGTAQVYDFKARAYTHRYNASFLGFAPVPNPQVVIAVTMNNTSGGTAGYGGPVAAPVFRDIATMALRILDVPKDLPDGDLRAAAPAKPDVTDADDLAIAGLGEPPADDVDARADDTARIRAVSSNTPSPPVPADSAARATESDVDRRPFFQAASVAMTGPKVPSFRGMTLRQVLEESSANGLQVEVGGAVKIGLVREQDPPAGAHSSAGKTDPGSVCKMTLAQVLAGVKLKSGLLPDVTREVAGLEYDSRRAGKDFVFFAFAGSRVDGRGFAQEAMQRGALAVVSDQARPADFSGAMD